MAVPTMRPGITSREFVRVAGGFGSAAVGASPTGGLDIDNAGNLATDGDVTANAVGIGTSAGTERLHVFTSADESIVAEVECTSTGASAAAVLKATGDGGSALLIQHGTGRTLTRYGVSVADYTEILALGSAGLLIGSQEAVDIVFGTNSAERMRIDSGGNVGIGTTNPGADLDVAGDAIVDDSLSVGRGSLIAGIALVVQATDTATSDILRIIQGSTGDCTLSFVLSGGDDYMMGIDNSDGDKFKIAQSISNLGTNTRLSIDNTGAVTIPDLAGTGTRTVVVDANGVLSAP